MYFESDGQTLAVNLSQEEDDIIFYKLSMQHTELVYSYVDNYYQDSFIC